ncbi:sporulation protein YpjB [Paenibacillus sp. GCM10023250]|uniref:sporulation protein YpjB n=1 Tax=Paenibacillus sp. GCM10023250 TaxID=3252648 RepID=UPI003623E624
MKASTFFALVCAGFCLILASGCSLKPAQYAASAVDAIPEQADVNNNSSLEQLSAWSDAFYSAANRSNRQEAYMLLQRIEGLASAPEVRGSGTPVGWQAFDLSLQAAKKAMPQKGTTTLWYTEAARLKLASDAVFRPKSPLWLQYQDILKDDAQRIRTSWQSQSEDRAMAAKAAINIYGEHVDRLEVAALMQRDAGSIEAVKERIGYMRGVVAAVEKGQMRPDSVLSALDSLTSAANALFRDPNLAGEATAAEVFPPGVTVGQQRHGSMLIGEMFIAAFVMGVLGFIGWRKYRDDRNGSVPISRNKL